MREPLKNVLVHFKYKGTSQLCGLKSMYQLENLECSCISEGTLGRCPDWPLRTNGPLAWSLRGNGGLAQPHRTNTSIAWPQKTNGGLA